jgi:hypothetical protein
MDAKNARNDNRTDTQPRYRSSSLLPKNFVVSEDLYQGTTSVVP